VARRVTAAPGATMPVFYLVYAKPGSTSAVTAIVEVSRDGQVVARGRRRSPRPTRRADHRPLPDPPAEDAAGTYQVKVTVSADGDKAEETTTVTVDS